MIKRNLLSMERKMQEGDFESLLCKANKEKCVKSASYEVEKFKLKTIKTDTPLFKEVMVECGVKEVSE